MKTKPGAMPGSTALARAREAGSFTPAHEAFWAETRKVNGDAEGTRQLIDVLLLHRSMAAGDVIAGIAAPLSVGAVTADVVAVEARRNATTASGESNDADDLNTAKAVAPVRPRVVSLTQRRLTDPAAVIAGLPPDTRPLPNVAAYDELLPKRRTSTSAAATSQESAS